MLSDGKNSNSIAMTSHANSCKISEPEGSGSSFVQASSLCIKNYVYAIYTCISIMGTDS
jgi:hypothetical protein